MAKFKIKLLTSLTSSDNNIYTGSFLGDEITSFDLKNLKKLPNPSITDMTNLNFSHTYDEKYSVHLNSQKELNFKMNRKILVNQGWIENPYARNIHIGTILSLEDKDDNLTLFIVKDIKYTVKENNIIYDISCQDLFSYQLARQSQNYSIINDEKSGDFLGAFDINYWAEKIVKECKITYDYIPTNKPLYLLKEANGQQKISTIIEKPCSVLKVIKNDYKNNKEYNDLFIFSLSNVTSNQALIQLAEKLNMNLVVKEFNLNGDIEFLRYFWFEPKKKIENYSGLKLSPYTDIQNFSFSHSGKSLLTVLDVRDTKDVNNNIITLLPNVSTFWHQYFKTNEWDNSFFSNGYFSNVIRGLQVRVCNVGNAKRIGIDGSIEDIKIPKLYDRIYITDEKLRDGSVTGKDETAEKTPYNSEWTIVIVIDKDNTVELKNGDLIPKELKGTNKTFKLKVGNAEVTSNNLSSYSFTFYFKRDYEKEDLVFAKLADEMPWLENKIINFGYFLDQNLISKYQYAQLTNLLNNNLRIVNGKLLAYSTDYYRAKENKMKKINNMFINMDKVGAMVQDLLIDPLTRGGDVEIKSTASADFVKAYSNFLDKKQNIEKIVDYNETINEYFNKYLSAQQNFLKNIYNFKKYFNEPCRVSGYIEKWEYDIAAAQKGNDSGYTYSFEDIELENLSSSTDTNYDEKDSYFIKTQGGALVKVDVVNENNYQDYYVVGTVEENKLIKIEKNETYSKEYSYFLKTKTQDENGKESYTLTSKTFDDFKKDAVTNYYTHKPLMLLTTELDTVPNYMTNSNYESFLKNYYLSYKTPEDLAKPDFSNLWTEYCPLDKVYSSESKPLFKLEGTTWTKQKETKILEWDVVNKRNEYKFFKRVDLGKEGHRKGFETLGNYTSVGAGIGNLFGPWGTVIGAGVGAVVGGIVGGITAYTNYWDGDHFGQGGNCNWNLTQSKLEDKKTHEKISEFVSKELCFIKDPSLISSVLTKTVKTTKRTTSDGKIRYTYTTTQTINDYPGVKDGEEKPTEPADDADFKLFLSTWKTPTRASLSQIKTTLKFAANQYDKVGPAEPIVFGEKYFYLVVPNDDMADNLGNLNNIKDYPLVESMKSLTDITEDWNGKTLKDFLAKVHELDTSGSYPRVKGSWQPVIVYKLTTYSQVAASTENNNINDTWFKKDSSIPIDWYKEKIVTSTNCAGKILGDTIYEKETKDFSKDQVFYKRIEQEGKNPQYEKVYNLKNSTDIEKLYRIKNKTLEANEYTETPNEIKDKVFNIAVRNGLDLISYYTYKASNIKDKDNISISFEVNNKKCSCVITPKQTESKKIEDYANGNFWFAYRNNVEIDGLTKIAAEIETNLTSYWSQAYTSSKYCEYFIPEQWTPVLSSGGVNMFSFMITEPIVTIEEKTSDPTTGTDENTGEKTETITRTAKSKITGIKLTNTFIPDIETTGEIPSQYLRYKNSLKPTNSTTSKTNVVELKDLDNLAIKNAVRVCGFDSIEDWTCENIEGATDVYYYVKDDVGGFKWNKLVALLNLQPEHFEYFSGQYHSLLKQLVDNYQSFGIPEYEKLITEKEQIWKKIYTEFPNLILEGHYENKDVTTSEELYVGAKLYLDNYNNPERQYNITIMDNDDVVKGYYGQELNIGDPIQVNADEFYNEQDDVKTTLRQILYISDISYDLRKDSDIQLTVNDIKYEDQVMKKLANLVG